MEMWSDFLSNSARPIHKWAHYFPIYELHLSRFRNRPVTMLEIGVQGGGSLQLWKKYLGPHAQIVGIDINPVCASLEEEQIAVRVGDQSDVAFLARVLDEFGTFNAVIDDGSHKMADVSTSFDFLYPRIAADGLYLVEDLHTAYWQEYGGGLRKPGSFIERCKSMIDDLNADHSRGVLTPSEFTRSTLSMHIYDSVVVFEKGRHLQKRSIVTPPATPA